MADTSSEKSQDILREEALRQCYIGNFQSVMSLLKEGLNGEINKDQEWLGSLLECAVQWGKLEVVEFLTDKFKVNINIGCRITDLGFGSALIAAIRCNNMVEDLINMGADVNVVTDVTPLTEACVWGDLTVVKLLLEKGADVNLRTSRGDSPLMAASCEEGDQATEIIQCLLDHGADCNLQNDIGNTALHRAVWFENAQTVRMLLQQKPQMLPNKKGLTSLFVAAYNYSDEIFDLFQSSQFVKKKDKVDALEHKATYLAPCDMEGVYQLLHQAMEMRYEDTSDVLKKPVCEPVAAFGNVCESQTLRELEARKGMNYVLLMECLAIEDRLLGRNGSCLDNNFYWIWRALFTAGLCDRALSLFEYAIESVCERFALRIFRDILELESKTPNISVAHMLSTTERGLQCAITILKSYKKGYYIDSLQNMILACQELLNACIQFDVTADKQRAQIQAKCFNDLLPFPESEFCTSLHTATSLLLNEWHDIDISVYKSLVQVLVKCGANINKKDLAGNVIMARVLNSNMSEDQAEIVDFLLKQGANPAYLKTNASFPRDITNDAKVLQLLRPYYPLPLLHIAAFAVVNNRIQYEGQVPEMVAKFIDGHM